MKKWKPEPWMIKEFIEYAIYDTDPLNFFEENSYAMGLEENEEPAEKVLEERIEALRIAAKLLTKEI